MINILKIKCPVCGKRENLIKRTINKLINYHKFHDFENFWCESISHRCHYVFSISGKSTLIEFSFDAPLFYNDWVRWYVGTKFTFNYHGKYHEIFCDSHNINDIYAKLNKFIKMQCFL